MMVARSRGGRPTQEVFAPPLFAPTPLDSDSEWLDSQTSGVYDGLRPDESGMGEAAGLPVTAVVEEPDMSPQTARIVLVVLLVGAVGLLAASFLSS